MAAPTRIAAILRFLKDAMDYIGAGIGAGIGALYAGYLWLRRWLPRKRRTDAAGGAPAKSAAAKPARRRRRAVEPEPR